ncbi:methyltransferase family protein [Methylosinus sp. sav-2]|uniref:class I SAM-dependent methyltransferase n=1 Tax=Methylosinus sp. sav-2 TaxID=2485168 RepID=UPI00068B4C77|nr:class I SAM-dependent methyltransferase [Methylosinus sp. sav-2]TDX59887.1 methyltransferase family protein [Methylosinus sp. sav-2]
MIAESAQRRLRPRIFDTDWLLLRAMRVSIEKVAAQIVKPGAIAVDFGCGSKPYQPIFEAHGASYLGADFADAEITIDKNGRVDALDASADLVVSFQVLEHVPNVGSYLHEARRLLRSDGRLVLSTHGNWFYHPHPEDYRRWTRLGLLTELAEHGFETIECVPLLGLPAWTTLLRLTCGYHAIVKLPVLGRFFARTLAIALNLRALIEDAITPEWVTRDNACVYLMLCRPTRISP